MLKVNAKYESILYSSYKLHKGRYYCILLYLRELICDKRTLISASGTVYLRFIAAWSNTTWSNLQMG